MNIGFTGTREGMTISQKGNLFKFLEALKKAKEVKTFHHGCCIGADSQAHHVALGLNIPVILHPPINNKAIAVCVNSVGIWPKATYLERNKDIVDSTDILIAAPKTKEEIQRSGTWATVRYAREKGKPILFLWPEL